ncbi:MAG TPA: C25 family cysteine peptidase [Candidatus Deferrimicrobium sp.]|nr:C25 family cysteine peptidase [Candidatus Deferrimicrobium sp.]
MRKRKSIHSKVIIFFMVLVLNYFLSVTVFGDTGVKWVSVKGAGESTQVSQPELQVVQSDERNLTVLLKTSGFFADEQEENDRVYTSLQLGKYNSDMKPGYPRLPVVRQYIEIPPGKAARLKVIPGPAVTFKNYTISPVRQPGAGVKNGVERLFYCDENVYNADSLFPSQSAYLDKSERLRGHDIALIHICPFQYNPAQKVLHVYPHMEVQVTFVGEAQPANLRVQSSQFDSFIRGIVVNPGAANKNPIAKMSVMGEGADFLIITAPEFLAAANALHDHKESLGIDTVVKTTNDTGITGSAIKNYIQNAYDTWSPAPSYVLLLGDVVYIPAHYRTADPADSGNSAIGTDLYYACVDGADYQPDIFLGRISVDTLAEAQTVVQKIINYENNPPVPATFYANAAMIAHFKDNNEDGYEDNRNVKTTEEIRDFLLRQGGNIERIYTGDTYWSNPTHFNYGDYGNGEPLPPDLLISNGFTWNGDSEKTFTVFNSGAFLVIHRGPTYYDGWAEVDFRASDIPLLNNGNLLPVVFSNSSETGHYDTETDEHYSNFESFCELMLRKGNGGAVAAIGPSRTGYDGYSDFMDEGFIDSIWPDFLPAVPNPGASSRLGPMLNHGKIAMDIMWGDPQGLRLVEYEIVHLFGDPTLSLWTQQPGSPGTQTVKIQSDPGIGIPITVSQSDVNGNGDGTTFFTRTYPTGTVVTLTAPATFYGTQFLKWMVDGVIVADPSIQLTMDRYHLVTVFYADEKKLDVKSYPVNGVPITVTPDDNTGSGNGNTNFSRYYNTGVEVTLTAPTGFNGRNFVRWRVDGAPDENQTIHVIMDAAHTVSAEFSILSVDKKILIIDKNLSMSAQKIKNAIQANGFNTEYRILTPAEIQPQLYPAVFFAGDSLTVMECVQFKKYLDNGGNLYIERISHTNSTSEELFISRFGIEDVWGEWNITRITGIPGTFTNGFDFTFPEDTVDACQLELADDVTDAYVIWNLQYSYLYPTGVARDAKTFKTIGVGFRFGDLPQNQQATVMGKYLNFFMPKSYTLTLTSPNGGENLTPGAVQMIAWNSTNIYGTLKISLWKDGLPVGIIADGIDSSRANYRWLVGNYKEGEASPGTGFNIKIEENGTGVSDMSNAPFAISAVPSLRVISPNGGESLIQGTSRSITWKSTNVSGTLKISLWKNGIQQGIIGDGINASLGSFPWTVGSYDGGLVPAGAGYKVKIEENGSAVSDLSAAPFTILASPSLAVISPNGGENLLIGTIHPLTWSATNVTGALKISLWQDGAPVGIIADDVDSSRKSYSWAVGSYTGGAAVPGAGYRVKLEVNGTAVSDMSDNSFAISDANVLTVVSPNGGENFSIGTTHPITWKCSHVTGTLKITLLKDGAAVGIIADNVDAAPCSYSWTAGNYLGGTASPGVGYKVKIEENGTAVSDACDNSFTLSNSSSLTITTPNGGENLTAGTIQQITWSAANVKNVLKITLWKDNSLIGVIAAKVDATRNSYRWTVGNYAGGIAPAGAGYKVKIEENGTPFSDLSDASFTILATPSITVTSPNGGENLTNGSTHFITWQAVNISGTLKISLWNGDYLMGVIADNIDPAMTSYLWTVDAYSSSLYKIKIEENGTAISDMSDGFFTISDAPSITSISISYSPSGNNFFLGQIYEIHWNLNNIKRPLKITLWKDGALVGVVADYLDPTVDYYRWKMSDYAGGTAAPGSGYKLKIEEHDTGVSGISSTPFTILPIPLITVTSPAEGEVLTKGTTFNITWKASNVPWTLNIRLLQNNQERGTIAYDVNPGVTSYQWTVGDLNYETAPEGSGYQIEVNLDGTNFSGRSNPYFAIYYPPSVTVISPDGGEEWGLNDVKNITWEAEKLDGTLKLTLWKDSVSIGVIADGIDPALETYSWAVGSYSGGKVSPGTGYQIKIEENGSTLSDMSNAPFEITPAHTIQVLSPNGGENFPVGTTQSITWTTTNVTGDLLISLWRDDVYCTTIDYVDPATTSYQWFVDEAIGEGYKIKIQEAQTAYSDMSDNWFTISGAYSLRVTAPNGGEQWAKNTVRQITWTSTGLYGSVTIYLTKEGEDDEYIAHVADIATGYYNWTVDGLAGTGYKIKIKTNQVPYIYDKSNNTFTITDN